MSEEISFHFVAASEEMQFALSAHQNADAPGIKHDSARLEWIVLYYIALLSIARAGLCASIFQFPSLLMAYH